MARPPASTTNKKIVIADDEQFIAIAYRDGLTRAGFEVKAAGDGAEALAAIKKEKPDLVLLDLIMPKMNGFDVLRAMKADKKLKTIPVMVLTNLSQATDEAEARSLGADDFIIKSDLSLKDLIAKLGQVLG
jgi:two-component system, OmpR family, alkaline phosphatase synthesis response regulator PhoP